MLKSVVGFTVVLCLGLAGLSVSAFSQEALQERIVLCTSCHGENGLPEDPEVPIIWGQHFYYLYVQLRDYKAGRRANETMQGIVADLTKDDMKALAQHFSEKTWPGINYNSEQAMAAKGETATAAGQCPQCHLGGYNGDSRVPRLAGQKPEYLERTMREFKEKVRLNSPAKGSLMESYSDEDVAAMASFLAGL